VLAVLSKKRIILGVTGGIAAYKACDIVRRLKELQADVRVVMTPAATAFVTPLTFQALSGYPVASELFDGEAEFGMDHIALARWADIILIAPLTANSLANLANGQAVDLLTTLCLATQAPIVLASAMNQQMWLKSVVQENMKKLEKRGFINVGVGYGEQACGESGSGRLLEPLEILEKLAACFLTAELAGKHVVITAGPTRETIDPVRFISNPSSGKMGYALAQAAQEMGAQVTLISGPVTLPVPIGVEVIQVESAVDMHAAVFAVIRTAQLFIATAAVGDYRVMNPASQKLSKTATLQLELVANPDIVADVAALADKPFCVGFAAQTHDVLTLGLDKLIQKNLDMICVNDVSQLGIGFNSDDNAVTVLWQNGERRFDCMPKSRLAKELIKLIKERYEQANRKI